MINLEELLKPTKDNPPCGPDLSNDPRFEALETIFKGKPEVEVGAIQRPAEPPDWGELEKASTRFLGESKHLRVAIMLCCALLKTGGVAGFRDGLQVLRGLLEQYWAALYPLLDPEDNNDPTQRLNLLRGLTQDRGSFGTGWLTILDYLYTAPICQPKGAPPITFDLLQAAKKKVAAGESTPVPAPDPAKLAAALRDGGGERVVAHHQALQASLDAVRGIDQFLTATLGASNTISFDALEKALQEMLSGLQPYLPGAATEAGAVPGPAGATGDLTGASPIGVPISGSIRSREDVVSALDSICKYYDQAEPGSPVPFLLRRAQKLATMNFLQAMKELNLATIDNLRPSMGSTVDGEAAAT
jgi:type VI secretion system protein ImpA